MPLQITHCGDLEVIFLSLSQSMKFSSCFLTHSVEVSYGENLGRCYPPILCSTQVLCTIQYYKVFLIY